ncbi:MAG: methyltransferase domain-containing protein [Chloroflexi bacterium]|nr:methyltransferase domain-containing protein [Chloroflexota bacterium]
MNWYDLISPLYDLGATGSGGPRREAVAELRLQRDDIVLDIACGTGLNFPYIEAGIGPEGLLIGLDFSVGMLAKARRKVERRGWANVRLIQADARTLAEELLREQAGVDRIDKVLCTLGFTVVPDWEAVFERSCALLKPSGRYAIMDWYVKERSPFSWFLNSISQGDVSRRTWHLLEENTEDYGHQTFIGGNVFVAAGTVPGAAL